MLAGNRALDLTTRKGHLCGRILADLGVEVIKVEPPGGDEGRSHGPFWGEKPHPEKSLPWFVYNLGKKGITLNIENVEGRELLKRLILKSDFIIESFSPGYMEKLGLGYDAIREINRGIIFTSITPFGQSGPYADFQASDLVSMAMGGFMYLTGDSDRPPISLSFPVADTLASVQATLGSLIAFHYRQQTGVGQYVDVSIQESVTNTLTNALPTWELNKILTKRVGPFFFRGSASHEAHQRVVWPCKDGNIVFMAFGGKVGAKANRALVNWMNEEGMADDFINAVDWNLYTPFQSSTEYTRSIEDAFARFFKAHTREELQDGAHHRDIFLHPAVEVKDIISSPQLKARDYWIDIAHPELGTAITYPGTFAKFSKSPLKIGDRAPLIGEHNHEIYNDVMGLSPVEIQEFKNKGII